MSTVSVRLPNGKIMKNVPKDATQEQIQDAAISLGAATLEDFGVSRDPAPVDPVPTAPTSPAVQEGPSASPRLGGPTAGSRSTPSADFFKENIDIPISMGGAAAGAYMGSPAGPVGVFMGGLIGGAVGTFTGSLVADEVQGEDLDYAKAVEEAMISAGFDVGTLGAGKFIKPAFVQAKKALGFTPKEAAKELMDAVPEVGTPESLKATQKMLEGKGASLTPYQAGVQGVSVLKEKIARAGLLSSAKMEQNANLVNEAASEALSDVVNRFSVNIDGSSEEVAEVLFDVVQQGKRALSENYSNSLNDLVAQVGTKRVNIRPLSKLLDTFVSSRQGEVVNELSDDTIKYIEKLKPALSNPNASVSLKELITIDKKLSSEISSTFGNNQSPLYNQTVERELGMLSNDIRELTYSLIGGVDEAAAKKYRQLKGDYAAGMQGLLPKINKGFVTQASAGNYKSLGNLLTKAGNVNQVVAFKKSLKEAFDQAGKTADPSIGVFISYDEADALIKKAFLQRTFPDLQTGEFSIQRYKDLANRLSDKTEAAKYRAILGDDYPRVKQIINLMSEAAEKPQSNLGELFLRHKEMQGFAAGSAIIGGGFVSPTIPLLSGAAIFLPRVFAQAATNPKHVNKLMAFNTTEFKTQAKREAAAAVLLSDIVDSMSEEEQAELRNSLREANQKSPSTPQ